MPASPPVAKPARYIQAHPPIRDISSSPPHALHRQGDGGYASRQVKAQIVSHSAQLGMCSCEQNRSKSGGSLGLNQSSRIVLGAHTDAFYTACRSRESRLARSLASSITESECPNRP
jgi:hypothetical protein